MYYAVWPDSASVAQRYTMRSFFVYMLTQNYYYYYYYLFALVSINIILKMPKVDAPNV